MQFHSGVGGGHFHTVLFVVACELCEVCVCVICGGFLVILSGPVVLLVDFGYMGWVLIYRVL